MEEHFSIEFGGSAFEKHEIPAAALAQSLLALDGLALRAAEAAYGKAADVAIKVKGNLRPGSFIVDLLVQHGEAVAVGAGAVTILTGVISVGKWAFGKRVKIRDEQQGGDGTVRVENEAGQSAVFNQCAINIYHNSRTASQLARLTQTLDMEGVDGISLLGDGMPVQTITKEERHFFRQEEGIVLTDNESEIVLEVVGPMLNGSPKCWRFSEGEDGIEFTANVEDEEFLSAVKERRHVLVNGTTILAVVRTVQRKNVRTRTDRTVVEVKAVYPPPEEEQKEA